MRDSTFLTVPVGTPASLIKQMVRGTLTKETGFAEVEAQDWTKRELKSRQLCKFFKVDPPGKFTLKSSGKYFNAPRITASTHESDLRRVKESKC